jgi:hypothetical protein
MILGNWPFFSFWPLTMASIMDGWSDPRLTKTFLTPASHRDSKKANEAVYLRTSQWENMITHWSSDLHHVGYLVLTMLTTSSTVAGP